MLDEETKLDPNTQNHDVWQWLATGTLTLAAALGGFILKSFGLRLTRVEDMHSTIASQVASTAATVEQINEIVTNRDAQAHEGYQRLARLEEIGRENQVAIRDGRQELQQLRELIMQQYRRPPA